MTDLPETIPRTATLLCDLGTMGFLRLLSINDRSIIVETRVRSDFRVVRIDRITGQKDTRCTSLPLINTKLATFSGKRWVKATNKKVPARMTEISWQDNPTEKPRYVVVNDEWALHTMCPSTGASVFAATRISTEHGGGHIICCRENKIAWKYQPPDRLSLNYYKAEEKRIMLGYANRAACFDDGSGVAFSFYTYLYVLNSDGILLTSLRMAQLCSDLFNRDFSKEEASKKVMKIGPYEIQFPFISFGNFSELPAVSAIVPISVARVFLVAYTNVLIWLTSDGKVAHFLELSLGSVHDDGEAGRIESIHASSDGRVIIAYVKFRGISVVIDGKEVSSFRTSISSDYRFAFDDVNRLIAIYQVGQSTIGLYDLMCKRISEIPSQNRIDDIHIPERSQLLFVNGDITQVFDLQ